MKKIILFVPYAPHLLASELTQQGFEVYEALAISEVLALSEQHPTASIIITSEVDQDRANVIAQHWPTVRLHREFKPMNVWLN